MLDGEYAEIRDRTRWWLGMPGHEPVYDLPIQEHRELVLVGPRSLPGAARPRLGLPSEFGGQDDVGGSVAAFETLALGDLSLLVKCGVQFGLFGGAVLHLGTERHHEAYLRDIVHARRCPAASR